ncbi:early activation antigen CD69-like [Corythoichthys intestinalis]|uniref:early activation antigen CD69-like n=1 Tax=Corythoichthys intestinalis TaxID=161448 RepID=UPI0025A64A27|nr:early activation antigen CD69-like [Corythoichthys intestinalis]
MKSNSTFYPASQVSWIQDTCDKEQCSALTPQDEHRFHCCYPCPSGWVRLDQSCFFFSTFNMSRLESEWTCSSKGGILAVIKSDKVQTFLTQNGNGLKYWIDGSVFQDMGTNDTQDGDWIDFDALIKCTVLDTSLPAKENKKLYDCSMETYFICQVHI